MFSAEYRKWIYFEVKRSTVKVTRHGEEEASTLVTINFVGTRPIGYIFQMLDPKKNSVADETLMVTPPTCHFLHRR